MKLIIDIPEEIYIEKKEDYIGDTLDRAIANGTLLSEELEKIKTKINLEDVDCQYEEDYEYSGGLQKAIEIIDNHISELKGEQE